jgi:hypothetical protein
MGAGTQTAALGAGGEALTAATELYDGTSWASNPNGLNTARIDSDGAGTQTAAVAFGGYSTLYSSNRRMEWSRFSNNSYNHSFLTLYLSI